MPGAPQKAPRRIWVMRMVYMVLFWAAGVAALALVAYSLRVFMGWAGLSA